MIRKRQVSAKDIMGDLDAGATNEQLMKKYHLTPKGLASVFRKLIATDWIGPEDLDRRLKRPFDPSKAELRKEPRLKPGPGVQVCDLDDMTRDLSILDWSSGGLKVQGIAPGEDEEKTFFITGPGLLQDEKLNLKAQCRWAERDSVSGMKRAGFAITYIDPEADAALRALMACS